MLRELNNLLLDLEKSAQGNESKLTKCHDAVINEFSHSIQTQIIELLKDREVSRFFMLLFQLLKIIDKKIDENIYLKTDKSVTKKMYSNIVRASISEKAMQLLMVNVLHENFKPYKELVEKFAFFEHTSFLKMKDIIYYWQILLFVLMILLLITANIGVKLKTVTCIVSL